MGAWHRSAAAVHSSVATVLFSTTEVDAGFGLNGVASAT